MPTLKHRPLSYSLHKASGQAIVKIDGRFHYLVWFHYSADADSDRGSAETQPNSYAVAEL